MRVARHEPVHTSTVTDGGGLFGGGLTESIEIVCGYNSDLLLRESKGKEVGQLLCVC